ncbi:MAG TPA: alpha/beta hydrolase [Baekduia sp.]
MIGAAKRKSDPFDEVFDVDVAGGPLRVARAGPPPGEADSVVLAVHGVTASLMTWRSIARTLGADSRVCLLAPDLRGRGRSATLPGPYGVAAHVDDLIAVLDHAGARQAVLAGHSLGAYVVARLAAEHPERAAGLVLLDAGLPLPPPDDGDELLEMSVENSIMRLGITFPSVEAYVAGWRAHPAFAKAWDEDVDAYARYDLVEAEDGVRCVASAAAVRTDTSEMVFNEETRSALAHVCRLGRVYVLRAERGLFDDADDALIPLADLHAFATAHPEAHVEEVADVNHYTLVMGHSPGPARVTAAIAAACAG